VRYTITVNLLSIPLGAEHLNAHFSEHLQSLDLPAKPTLQFVFPDEAGVCWTEAGTVPNRIALEERLWDHFAMDIQEIRYRIFSANQKFQVCAIPKHYIKTIVEYCKQKHISLHSIVFAGCPALPLYQAERRGARTLAAGLVAGIIVLTGLLFLLHQERTVTRKEIAVMQASMQPRPASALTAPAPPPERDLLSLSQTLTIVQNLGTRASAASIRVEKIDWTPPRLSVSGYLPLAQSSRWKEWVRQCAPYGNVISLNAQKIEERWIDDHSYLYFQLG